MIVNEELIYRYQSRNRPNPYATVVVGHHQNLAYLQLTRKSWHQHIALATCIAYKATNTNQSSSFGFELHKVTHMNTHTK